MARPKQTAEQKQTAIARKQIVDEYGRLDADVAPHRGKLRRLEELGKVIRAWHISADAEKSVSSSGDQFEVVLSARGMQTAIVDMASVYDALGHECFLKLATVTIKALEENLDAASIVAMTAKERTGYRSVVVKALNA